MKTLLLLLALEVATWASAQEPSVASAATTDLPRRSGTWSFYFENDLFGGTDQRYTNGVRIGWTSPALERFADENSIGALGGLADELWMGHGKYERNVALTLGQAMYTPTDITRSDLIVNDRPYAGWLYLGVGFIWKNEHMRDSLVLNMGVVGPASLAEETQRLVHEARGILTPRGWDNQLHNEFGIALAYEHMWRIREKHDFSSWDWDVLPYLGVTLGNVATNARAGAELRFGYNLPNDFGTAAIDPAVTTPTPLEAPGRRKNWYLPAGAHFFVRAEGRAVARDIFLDGNTFQASHSVDKEPFVGDLAAGISLNWKNTALTYSYVIRSREFKGQTDAQVFGSIMLSWTF